MLTADSNGKITGKFTIPENVPVGSKNVVAIGQGGSEGNAIFIGSGQIETRLLRQIFTRTIVRTRRGDPLAQTFVLPVSRHVTSIDVQFGFIGDVQKEVICQIRPVELGVVSTEVIADSVMDMSTVSLNEWTKFSFKNPTFLQGDQTYAAVFLTDDADHTLCIAQLGKFDSNEQQWVTAQPYQVGVLQSSSNGETWTPHQNMDLMYRVNGANFTANERIVDAGDLEIINCSDLIISAQSETPNVDTSIDVLITRADGSEIIVQDNQPIRFNEFVTETVNVKFILKGTDIHSPILYPIIQYIMGELQETGDYVSRAMPADDGTPLNVVVAMDCMLPAGDADMTVEIGVPAHGEAAEEWTTAQIHQTLPLGDGWQERVYKVEGYQNSDARVRITLNGNPASRPQIRKLRSNISPDPVNITGTPDLAAA